MLFYRQPSQNIHIPLLMPIRLQLTNTNILLILIFTWNLFKADCVEFANLIEPEGFNQVCRSDKAVTNMILTPMIKLKSLQKKKKKATLQIAEMY